MARRVAGGDLIDRNARADAGAVGFLGMDAGEISSGCAGVIAAAIAQRAAGILSKAGEHENVLAVRRERARGCAAARNRAPSAAGVHWSMRMPLGT